MILFILFLLVCVYKTNGAGFELILKPNCKNCKWIIPNTNNIYEPSRCRLFSHKVQCGNKEITVHRYTVQCRLNSDLCGMDGSYYEKQSSAELEELQKQITDLETQFNGEINEKNEIKRLEEELAEIKKKIHILLYTQQTKN